MTRSMGRLTWLYIALALVVLSALSVGLAHRFSDTLPYKDHFAENKMGEWKIYGGNWMISSDELTNASDDTGAKAVTGSPRLQDMVMNADVRLTSSFGDAGFIVRVSNAEEGTNAFDGYYAGIRLPDQLLLSRMDFGFTPLQRVQIAQGVNPGVWYHLMVRARGCDLYAEARDMSGKVLARAEVHETSSCMRRGSFGLRSFAAGGSWRRIQVKAIP